MGHMLPTHQGKCYRPHGHRYVIEAEVETDELLAKPGESDDGMVMDFSIIKEAMAEVLDQWDHRFVVANSDDRCMAMLAMVEPDHGAVIAVPFAPTAENLAQVWGNEIDDELSGLSDDHVRLVALTVWETPNARVRWEA